ASGAADGVAASGAAADQEAPAASQPVPAESVLVTLAVSAPDAERVVFGAEHGTLWLSLESADAPEQGTRILTEEDVLG
ncbi:hypothetical protein FJ693_20370, partial [Georgenia yuyongxinii]